MPTYEYRCKSCDREHEVFQSFKDKPLRKCDDCGGELQKVFHARGVVFKGSGFYATDSRGSSTSKTASAPTATGGDNGKVGSEKEKTKSTTSTSSTSSGD